MCSQLLNSPTELPSNADAIALASVSETTSATSALGQLQARAVHERVVIAEHQHRDGRLHRVVAPGLAGGAQVIDEGVIGEPAQAMLGKLSEFGQ